MDLSCPRTIRSEICQKCRKTIPLVQVYFRFELYLTVLKLLSKFWVNPWNFEQILAVFCVFLREMVSEDYRIIQTTPEYTIPENVVRIGQVVSEIERWIKKMLHMPPTDDSDDSDSDHSDHSDHSDRSDHSDHSDHSEHSDSDSDSDHSDHSDHSDDSDRSDHSDHSDRSDDSDSDHSDRSDDSDAFPLYKESFF